MPHRSIRLFLLLAICMMTNGCRRESISEPKRHYVIGFSQCTNDLWRQIMMIQMKAEAAKYPELSIVVSNAHNNTQLQIDQIREFIEAKVDLLIISPNESEPVTPIAVEAFDMGIPTIIWDRKIHSDHYTTCISADNYDIGRDVGRYINTLLPEGSTILEITGLMSSSPAVERHKGFLAEASESYSVHTISGDWKPEVAKERIEAIGQYRNIDLIFAHNDDMALAAYDAINEADSLSAQRIKFIGIDALVGVDAVLDGRLQASFLYPTGGDKVMAIARRILLGKRVEKSYQLQSALVDSHNAYTLKAQQEQIVSYQEQINKQKTVLEQYDRSVDNLKYSLWAVIIIALIAGGMGIYAIRLNLRLRRRNEILTAKNTEIEIATRELMDKHAQIENVTAHKLQFFTNITHEIRTPLTLIVGQVETLLQVQTFTPNIYHKILGIYKNSLQLRELITELLDFRKQEQGHMKIKVSRHNLVNFLYENYLLFLEYASSKQINFKFNKQSDDIEVWYDQKQMQKVVNNLLSNALKHTKAEDTISINVSQENKYVIIEIKDTGTGIAAAEIDKIFDRFYQTERLDSLNTGAGTGIGLALTKGIIELHHGTIRVESEPGKGSRFIITLKSGNQHFTEEQIIRDNTDTNIQQQPETIVPTVEILPDSEWKEEDNKRIEDAKMLIVEDNESIKQMLVGIFETFYQVSTASDGVEALEMIQKDMPSIILSDVVMPRMSGTELCKQIKTDFNTCHIPVVLLTARTAIEHNIEGLKIGADDYITKPFNTNLLISRCNNLVNSRRLLQEKFSKQPQAFAQMLATNPMDKEMLDRAMAIIERHLDNTDFNVNIFAREMGMARTNLFTKLKAVTGQTPNDFILSIRLKKGAVMLRNNPELNITEISDRIGFSSSRYFSKCFKEIYHVSPLAYRKGEESEEEGDGEETD